RSQGTSHRTSGRRGARSWVAHSSSGFSSSRTNARSGQRRNTAPAMCFDLDSRPPIDPIAGGSLDAGPLTLTSADGTAFRAFGARPANPSGAGIVILPDVRGLHPFFEELALRHAEHGIAAVAID